MPTKAQIAAKQAKIESLSPVLVSVIGTFINVLLQEQEGAVLFKGKVTIEEVSPDGVTVLLKFGKKAIYRMTVGRSDA